jgi:adenylate cyclase
MTIRKKIFLLAGILLALFAVVVGALAIIQKLNSDRIGNIVAYELPLSRLVAEFDVDTDRYELRILRLLRLDPVGPAELQAAISDKRALAEEMRTNVVAATALLDQAIQDPRYQTADRVDLARLDGSFKYLSRSLEGFLAVGELTISALAKADARRLGLPRSDSPTSHRPSVRTSPRFAATFPVSPIGRPAWSSQANGLTPI